MFITDSYDVILTGTSEEIIQKFKSFEANIVFGAENFCWPKQELESKYDEVEYNSILYGCLV